MIVYDVEIKRPVPDKRSDPIEGITYCNGWRDYAGMGVAVVCAYDYDADAYRVYCEDNLFCLQNLIDRHDLVVGFNSYNFDDPVMAAHGIRIDPGQSYDLLHEIARAKGYEKFNPGQCRGYGLDAVARANLNGMGKIGDGALAPVYWQNGMIGTVIDYCLGDVRLTRGLMDLVIDRGFLICPNTGEHLNIRC
jgi:hypothetical protein